MSDSAQSSEAVQRPGKEWPPADPNDQSPYPYPEVLEDWRWLFDELSAGHLEQYRGQFVAVCDKQVLGSGRDEPLLRQTVAAAHGMDPDRLVTMHLDAPEDATEAGPWPESD
jgi:hypothetical protein